MKQRLIHIISDFLKKKNIRLQSADVFISDDIYLVFIFYVDIL